MTKESDIDPFIEEMPRGYQKHVTSEHDNALNHTPVGGVWGEPIPDEPNPKSILLGRQSSGQYLSITDDRHMITFAGSRAGKGVSLIIPNMLSYMGSVIAIDPKGELATITAARRGSGSDYAQGMGGKVFVLDPFERAEGSAINYRAAFNPLEKIEPDSDDGLSRATMIADGLVVQETGNSGHFTAAARSFLRGLILYVCVTESGSNRSLIRVRELISQSKKDFDDMLEHMVKIGGVIGRAANALRLKSDNERTSVVSTADVQTDFLEDGAMRDVLSGHDFDLEDMKRGQVSVYLCLPAGRLATHGRWLRLMIALAADAMEATGALKQNEIPVLFVLDEFAALGHMATLEKAAGQIASFGAKLWPILQDVTQLKRDYKDSWETFIGNAGYVTAFGVTDLSTTEYLSKILGKTMVKTFTTSTSIAVGTGKSTSGSNPIQVVDLLAPHELSLYFGRHTDRILIKKAGVPPWVINRIKYYEDFIGFYDPAPGHNPPPTLAETQAIKDAQTAEEKAEDDRIEAEALKRKQEEEERRKAREEALKQAAETAQEVGKAALDQAGKFAKFMSDKLRDNSKPPSD